MAPRTFSDRQYDEARDLANETNQPLWDTHQIPDRYVVGHPTVEMEEDPDNEEWTEIQER